jgi:hypothetical protein
MTQIQNATEDDLLVSLTFHNMPAELLREFALKIVRPYFGGNLNEAVRSLMEKAITEETLVKVVTAQTKVIFKEEIER